jgi:multimeric flavodoxin WrbA
MNIVVINGTDVRGCTYRIKEFFIEPLREGNSITEFYLPKDFPYFCCGCKTCFIKSERFCPHAEYTMPIWNAMLAADLLVFAFPVYVQRAPGQVKALLDHLACHWMIHRPDNRMFYKAAVILTQSLGAPNGAAQKDLATSLSWLGVSDVKKLGFGLLEGVIWDEISEKRRLFIKKKTQKLAERYVTPRTVNMSLKTRGLFAICKMLHKKALKNEEVPSADNQYWIDKGWIKR